MSINGSSINHAVNHIKKNFECPKFVSRDRQLEQYLILRSKVELALLVGLHSGILDPWQGNLEVSGMGNRYEFNVVLPNHYKYDQGRHCRDIHSNSTASRCIGEEKHDQFTVRAEIMAGREYNRATPSVLGSIHTGTSGKDEHSTGKKREKAWFRVGTSSLVRRGLCPLAEIDGSIHEPEQKRISDFLYNVLNDSMVAQGYDSACVNGCDQRNHGSHPVQPYHYTHKTQYVDTRMIELFALLYEFSDERKTVEYLANWLQISDNPWHRRGWLDRRRGWMQHKEMKPLMNASSVVKSGSDEWLQMIQNPRGFHCEAIEVNHSSKYILPLTAWTKPSLGCRYYFNIPALTPKLYNSHLIADNKEATVVLTDCVETVAKNEPENDSNVSGIIWSTWYGEKAAVPRLNWRSLRGREVLYLISERPDISLKEAYETAMAVYLELDKVWGVKLRFLEHQKVSSSKSASKPNFIEYSPERFLDVARNLLQLEERELGREFMPKTMAQLVKEAPVPRDYILDPILLERSTTLCFAPTNIGKTWFALCIANTIAHGGAMVGRWKAPEPRKVLYIDSEMEEASLQSRVKSIAKMRFDGKVGPERYQKNLICISRSRSKESTESFKEHVLKYVAKMHIKFLVLDNITAFTKHNDSAKAWEDIHVWVDRLKKNGCSCFFVHHANKAGDQRGTSATTNAVDNVIHILNWEEVAAEKAKKDEWPAVKRTGNDFPGLRMHVQFDKGRDIYGEARRAVDLAICPNSTPPECGLIDESGELISDAELNNAAGTSIKNTEKASKSREQLEQRVYELLAEKKSIKQISKEIGKSVPWIYKIDGLTEHPNYKKYQKVCQQEKHKRNNDIIRRVAKGHKFKRIAEALGIGITTVKRIADDHWMEQIRKSKKRKPETLAEELGISENDVRRLLIKIKLERLPKFHAKGLSPDEIAQKLDIPLKRVLTAVSRIEKDREKRHRREAEFAKIARLYEEGEPEDRILASSGLPRRTAQIELNRLKKTDDNGAG